jgi:hypothetical protein
MSNEYPKLDGESEPEEIKGPEAIEESQWEKIQRAWSTHHNQEENEEAMKEIPELVEEIDTMLQGITDGAPSAKQEEYVAALQAIKREISGHRDPNPTDRDDIDWLEGLYGRISELHARIELLCKGEQLDETV